VLSEVVCVPAPRSHTSFAEGLIVLPTFLIDLNAFEARDLKVFERFIADAASPMSLRLTFTTSTTIESFPLCDIA
jgi:hypothetical protein